ncbi:MAG: Dinitrogenase iron-molybdenum cofactor biosynthesis protein [Herbinix sp.]|nr:Dinitrogenase iron-molybdenum cofactor biosynthesis protein [Herbinix sp.]
MDNVKIKCRFPNTKIVCGFPNVKIKYNFPMENFCFYIVEVEDTGEYYFEETRETAAACQAGSHSEEGMAQTVSLLADCKYVLVRQIGPGAEYELNKKGITAFAVAHYIEDAVKKLIYYNSEIKIS